MTAGSAGDDPQAPAAAPAGLDLDAKNRSAQVIGVPLCGRSLSRLRLRTACQALLPLADPGDVPAQPAVGCNDAVLAGQVRARLRHQGREPGDEVEGLEDHVRRAVAIGRLQSIADVPAVGQRESGGLRAWLACSKAWAISSSAFSLKAAPKNETPTGNPEIWPAGTVTFG